ncbi:hypothetical protein BKA70DRAFT_1225742 [Coprinopsis sp. MPI-PUGE-AT-0042]|nr:hypothetical protein BKA70DRAFT_1225742 [Coprinopsis sp. MPI-PUGE-AT-0042]
MNKDILTAIYTSQTKATNMAATLLTPSVHLNAVHVIHEDKPDELWETLAPNSTNLSLWSVVTCRIPVETEEAVMFTNTTTLQPTSTGGPAVVQSQPKCEEWKVMHMFPKGTPSIRIGMRVEMQDSFKDGAHQLETICLRVGTITRVWKREVNWLHYVVDLTTAVNFRIGENSMQNDAQHGGWRLLGKRKGTWEDKEGRGLAGCHESVATGYGFGEYEVMVRSEDQFGFSQFANLTVASPLGHMPAKSNTRKGALRPTVSIPQIIRACRPVVSEPQIIRAQTAHGSKTANTRAQRLVLRYHNIGAHRPVVSIPHT